MGPWDWAPGRWHPWLTKSPSWATSCRVTAVPSPRSAIGAFGVAVLHALPAGRQFRQVGTSWEYRTRDGWMPMDNPLDRANRDAERVRRWYTIADLDFVVRVYAGSDRGRQLDRVRRPVQS